MRILGINTPEDPLVQALWSSNTGAPAPPGTGRVFHRWTSRGGRFTGLFCGGSLTPVRGAVDRRTLCPSVVEQEGCSWNDPSRVQLSGPLSVFVAGFRDELEGRSYRPGPRPSSCS
jgi:hypothetical protein